MNLETQTKLKQEPYLGEVAEHLVLHNVSADQGLSNTEATARLESIGRNELADEEKEGLLVKILNQFKDFMIIILIVAAIASGVLGEIGDAILIIAIVVVNAVMGVIQEGKAEKAIEALQKMSALHARVIRDGNQLKLDAAELVPGDVVLLEAGDIVPADCRLIEASNVKAEEASLTGESVPVEKFADFVSTDQLGIGDRTNMLFSGTALTYGRARALIVKTGENTEMGQIAGRLKNIKQELTPLQQALNSLGKVLGTVCLLVCAVVFGVGLLQGGDVLELFLTAVSLAVAAIPEGLPAVVTIVLALGMNRMAQKHAIVKRLLAVETLGSVDTICSDKTGTLTQNEMTVTKLYAGDKVFDVTGTGYAPIGSVQLENTDIVLGKYPNLDRLLEIGTMCNEAELVTKEDGAVSLLGDPTEGAMLAVGGKMGLKTSKLLEKYPRLGDLPFDSERKMMSVFHTGFGEGELSLTKGAPDIVLSRCETELTETGDIVPLTPERREAISNANNALACTALRVLAFAFKKHQNNNFADAETQMTYVGLMGMIDPARPEARDAVLVCKGAGIRAVMITGDYKETAVAIAKQLGLMQDGDGVVTGFELENMSDETLRSICENTAVYARVSPEHKVRIVAALRDTGHIASMTGDGVNDAPALKQADIGVAMGITGTEVAKGSADMILTDDNFATIVSAVEEGRVIYSNIRKFVGFLLSCNVGEILVIFITNLLLGPSYAPLLPVQLLWLNLVTDSFPALALGREKGEMNIMKQKPRDRKEKILNREMALSIVVQSLAIFIAVFASFQIGRMMFPDMLLGADGTVLEKATSFHFFALNGFSPSDGARTMAFATLICAELLRAFSSRSEHYSVFQLGFFSNPTMNKSIIVSFGLMLVVMYVPFLDPIFHTVMLYPIHWLIIAGLAIIPFIAGEVFKLIFHRKTRVTLELAKQLDS